MRHSHDHWSGILHSAQRKLHEHFDIDHATLQPSFGAAPRIDMETARCLSS
jgi:Co/Zn/Cd efflux system component